MRDVMSLRRHFKKCRLSDITSRMSHHVTRLITYSSSFFPSSAFCSHHHHPTITTPAMYHYFILPPTSLLAASFDFSYPNSSSRLQRLSTTSDSQRACWSCL